MKTLYMWCRTCGRTTRHAKSGAQPYCLKCGEAQRKPDKNVPNVFPKGRGF